MVYVIWVGMGIISRKKRVLKKLCKKIVLKNLQLGKKGLFVFLICVCVCMGVCYIILYNEEVSLQNVLYV